MTSVVYLYVAASVNMGQLDLACRHGCCEFMT